MRTALQQEKKIAVCYNGSKYKVQEALGWIPTEFALLKNEELIKLDEDMEYMKVGLDKLKQRLFSGENQLSGGKEHCVDFSSNNMAGIDRSSGGHSRACRLL
eukprot:scaffold87429_cov73-Phaeocystis_antarctica.AAC.2